MNPLLKNNPFQFSFRNPNVRVRQLKSGKIFELIIEMDKLEWDCWADPEVDLTGMVVEVYHAEVSHKAESKKKEIPLKGGPISIDSAGLCNNPDANEYAKDLGFEDMKDMLYKMCEIESRAMLDHNEKAKNIYLGIKKNFNDFQIWLNENEVSKV